MEKALSKEISKLKVLRKRVDVVTLDQAISGLVKELIRNLEINFHIIFDMRIDFQQKEKFVT